MLARVREYLADDETGTLDNRGARVQVVRQRDQRLRKRQPASTRTCVIVHAARNAERLADGSKERPGNLEVECWIADTRATPIDDRGKPTVADEQVPFEDVDV